MAYGILEEFTKMLWASLNGEEDGPDDEEDD